MKTLISTLKAIRFNQILAIFLAGILVLFSTACSRPDTMATAPVGSITPGQSQSYKGGMNNFNDDDSKRLNTEAAAKAKALKDKVASRINKNGISSPDDLVDNVRSADLGKKAQQASADLRKQADDVKDSLQSFGDRGVKNVKKNTETAFDNASDAAANATDAAKNKVNSDVSTTKQAIDKAANAAKAKVNSDVNATKRTLDKAA